MKKILSALILTCYVGNSCAEPVTLTTIAAGFFVFGCVVEGGKKAVSWWRGDAEKENAKDQALQAAEKEKNRLKQESAAKQQEIANLVKRLEMEIVANETLAHGKGAAEEDAKLLKKELEVREQELLFAYIKCVENLSKEQCVHMVEVLKARSIDLHM